MTHAVLLSAALAILLSPRAVSAASISLVPTSQSESSHSYDVLLDTEGVEIGVFDVFLTASGGGLIGVSATDNVLAATGLLSSFSLAPNQVHYGGLMLDGSSVGPFDGVLIGTITVDHERYWGGGLIQVFLGPDPPSGFATSAGPVPSTTCSDPTLGCVVAAFALPEVTGRMLDGSLLRASGTQTQTPSSLSLESQSLNLLNFEQSVPEPGVLLLLSVGLAGLAFLRRA